MIVKFPGYCFIAKLQKLSLMFQSVPRILKLVLYLISSSNTYNDVQSNSSQYWKFQRHSLIMEYSQHHPLPPPFSLLAHIYLLFKWFAMYLSGKEKKVQYEGLSKILHFFHRESLFMDSYTTVVV